MTEDVDGTGPLGAEVVAGDRDALAGEALRISVGSVGGNPVVRLEGELDMLQEPALRDTFQRVERDRPPTVIVDLRGLSFIDSTGLRVFLEADARAKGGGRQLVFAKGRGDLPKVFHLTLLDRRLTFVDDPSRIG